MRWLACCTFVSCALLAVRGSGAEAVRILRGPYLQAVTSNSALVRWETSAPADAAVEVTSAGGSTSTFKGARDGTLHEVALTGLTAATPYRYRAKSGEAASPSYRWRTAPGRNAPASFAVLGSSCQQPEVFARIVERVREKIPDFILHTGDLVVDGTSPEQWRTMFFEPARELLATTPVVPVRGEDENQAALFDRFFHRPPAKRWFSFDWANAHFVALDSCGEASYWDASSEQTRWLDRDLAASRARWKFVVVHHPLVSSGERAGSVPRREAWEPIFSRHLVDLVLQGGDRGYERTYRTYAGRRDELLGVPYLVVGGGGAPLDDFVAGDWTAVARRTHGFTLVRLELERLTLESFDLEGRRIDHLVLSKDPSELPGYLALVESVATSDRLAGLRGLSELASSVVLFHAQRLAGHPDVAVRRALAEALNRTGVVEGLPHALRLLRGADTVIKREVATLFGKVADAKTAEAAVPLLAETDTQTRIGAARALARVKVPRARAALLKALADSDPLVRHYATLAFTRLATTADLATLEKLAQDPHPLVRAAVASGVGAEQFRWGTPLLIAAVSDRSGRVRNAARDSLRRISGQDFGFEAAGWRQWWSTQRAGG